MPSTVHQPGGSPPPWIPGTIARVPFLQCAVSPDGKHVAVRRGAGVTLHAADGAAVLAEGTLVYEDSTLVFANDAYARIWRLRIVSPKVPSRSRAGARGGAGPAG